MLSDVKISSEVCADSEEAKSDDYSSEMQSKMGSFLTYRHEDGMNFAHVLDDMIVGSCLQTPADLDRSSHYVRSHCHNLCLGKASRAIQ